MIEFLLICCLLCLIICTIACIRINTNLWYLCKYIKAIEDRLYSIHKSIQIDFSNVNNDRKKVIKLLYSINSKNNKNGTKKSTKCDKGQ